MVVVAALGRFFLPGPWHHEPLAAPAIPASGRFYLGVDTSHAGIAGFDSALGLSRPAVLGGYTKGDDGSVADVLSTVRGLPGTIPMVSWGVDFTGGKVADGSQDTYLRAQAKAVAAYGKPVFLRLDWEMNGSWYPEWDSTAVSASAYVAAWRHIWEIFQQQGATNAAFVWCPNVGDLGGRPWTDWYPGGEYVDWIGMDAYLEPSDATSYISGPGGLNALAAYAVGEGEPAMLAEWAPGAPKQDPVQAFNLVFAWADRYRATVKALVYFNYTGTQRDDLLVDNPSGAALFRRLVEQRSDRLFPSASG
ncbi:glycoside hydrolase family 26 protein [Actinospica sp.]|uniref:glycoside hydrolase family 26 protein n=1 Tax=Actinospica sp. TaxID=1872142 RepID=UPI002CD51BE8|nr:glycosyl hydrolase [Actinospica sp.]HWG23911.1 glycosyl hydrolase [Actinospica sp.]